MKALITGASSGIGRDMARYMSSLGYDLVLVARREQPLLDLKSVLKTNVEIVIMDLSVKENCIELHDRIKDVDVLINNAGFGDLGEFTETDLEKEISMIETNIEALHILTKLYLKDMVGKNKGHILNVASIAGFMTGPLMATYYASKNYVVALTKAIRRELKKKKSKVRISLLCPGPVDTNFSNVANANFMVKGLSSEYVAKYAINKMLKNKFLIIPGAAVKIGKFFIKILPSRVVEEFCYYAQKAKRK